jgi:predicted TPR repeat methyltransferase
LKQHSLTDPPLPYHDKVFSHVIACGVFHFFGRLDVFIDEACRVLQDRGIFALTVATPGQDAMNSDSGSWVEERTPWGLSLYKHGDDYLESQLKRCALMPLKYQRILQKGGADKDIVFKVVVSRKVSVSAL